MANDQIIVIRTGKWNPTLKEELQKLADAHKESLNRYIVTLLSNHIKTTKTKTQTVGEVKT